MRQESRKTKNPPYYLSAGYCLTVLFMKSTAGPCLRIASAFCGAPRHSARYDSVPQGGFSVIGADDRCFLVFSDAGFMFSHLLRSLVSAPNYFIAYWRDEIKKKQKTPGKPVRGPGPRTLSGLMRDIRTTCGACQRVK